MSARGHDVVIVDNLSRRKIDVELEVASLTPIRPLGERVRAWAELTGNHVRTEDSATRVKEYERLSPGCRIPNAPARSSISPNSAPRPIR